MELETLILLIPLAVIAVGAFCGATMLQFILTEQEELPAEMEQEVKELKSPDMQGAVLQD